MDWLALTFGSVLIWSIVSIIDKHIIEHELRDPYLATVIFGCILFIILTLFSYLSGAKIMFTQTAALGLLAGIFYAGAIFFYYDVLQKEEVSRVIPLLPIGSLLVLLFATVFLGEQLSGLNYIGIIFLIVGAICASLKFRKFHFSSVIWLALAVPFFFACRDVLLKYLSMQAELASFLFWLGFGYFIISAIILLIHHPRIRAKARLGAELLAGNNALSIIGVLLYFKAIQLGAVSLVAALGSTVPLFVFIFATTLSKLHPKFIQEKLTLHDLALKGAAALLVVVGSILIANIV